MPAYNAIEFDPPAPVALVSFVNPATGQRIDNVIMLLDTGADATVAPQSVFQALNAVASTLAYEIEYLEGGGPALSSAHLQMKWQGQTFTGDFLIAQTPYGIIGRNILNHLRLVLDGPKLHWDSE